MRFKSQLNVHSSSSGVIQVLIVRTKQLNSKTVKRSSWFVPTNFTIVPLYIMNTWCFEGLGFCMPVRSAGAYRYCDERNKREKDRVL